MADIILTVGAAPAAEWSQFKEDVTKMANELDKLTNKPYQVKIQFDSSSISAMRKQIDDLTRSLNNLGSGGSSKSGGGKGNNLAMTYSEATKAVREYYSAMTALGKLPENDIVFKGGRYSSASGDWDAMASALNRVADAYTRAKIAASGMSDANKAKFDQFNTEQMSKHSVEMEKFTNAQRVAAETIEGTVNTYKRAQEVIREYYNTMLEFNKTTNNDIYKNDEGLFESQSGKFQELADAMNKTSAAYRELNNNMGNFTLEHQLQLTEQMETAERNYNREIERTANKREEAARKSSQAYKDEQAAAAAAHRQELRNSQVIVSGSEEQIRALTKVNSLQKRMADGLNNWSVASKGRSAFAYDAIRQASQELENLNLKLQSGKITVGEFNEAFESIRATFVSSSNVIKSFGEDRLSFVDRLKGIGGELAKFMTVQRVVMSVIRTFKDMAQTSMQIESSMAQIKVVTGATDSELQNFFKTSTNLAQELGQSITDVAKSIENFSRLGYNLEDASELAKYANVLSNVADTDVETATTGLTSIIKGFDMDVSEAEHVTDVLVKVGQEYAISAEELMEAFERGGASMYASGTSFEKTAALFAAANASLQNASTVGTMFKTVSARVRQSKSELEELGEDYDTIAKNFSKYREEFMAITGIDIQDSVNSYSDLYDLFVQLAEVWDSLDSDMARSRVVEILGGTRNQSGIVSVITNIKDAIGAYDSAINSANTAMNANEIVMATTEKHIERLKASWQELSFNTMNSDVMRFFVDIANGIVNVVNSLGLLKTALAGLAIFEVVKNFKTIVPTLQLISTTIAGLGLKEGLGALLSSINPIYLGIIGIATAIGVVSTAVGAYRQHQEDLRRSTQESAQAFSESRTEIQDYISEAESLQSKLASNTLSETEAYEARSRLAEIQDSLISKYGEEAAGIDLVTESLENQIDALNNLTVGEAEKYLNDLKRSHGTVEEIHDMLYGRMDGEGRGLGSVEVEETAALEKLTKAYSDFFTMRTERYGLGEATFLDFIGSPEDYEAIDSFLYDLNQAESEFSSETYALLSSNLGQLSDDAHSIVDEYEKLYETALEAQIIADKERYRTPSGETYSVSRVARDYAKAVDAVNKAISDNDELGFDEATKSLQEWDSCIQDIIKDNPEYDEYFGKIRDGLNSVAQAQEDLNEVSEKAPSFTESRNAIKQYGLTVSQFKNAARFETVGESGAHDYTQSVQDFVSAVQNYYGIEDFNAAVERSATLLSSVGEIIDETKDEVSKSSGSSGGVLPKTLSDLFGDDSDFKKVISDYRGKLKNVKANYEKFLKEEFTESDWIDLQDQFGEQLLGISYDDVTESVFTGLYDSIVGGYSQAQEELPKELPKMEIGLGGKVFVDAPKEIQQATDAFGMLGEAEKAVADLSEEDAAAVKNYVEGIASENALAPKAEEISQFKGTIEDFYNLVGDSTFNDGISDITDKIGKVQDALDSMESGEFKDTDLYTLAKEIGHPELLTNMDDVEGSLRRLKEQLISGGDDVKGSASLLGYFSESIEALREAGSDEAAEQLENLYQIIANGVEETIDAKSAFDALGETLTNFSNYQSTVSSALEHSMSATGLTADEVKDLTDAYKGIESFDPAKLFEHTFNGIHLNRQELERLNEEIKTSTLEKLYSDLEAKKAELANAPLGSDTTGLENDISQAELLISAYEGMTSAYNEWIQAKSGGDERDSYASVGEGQKEVEKLLQQGWVEDSEVNKWLDLVLAESERTGNNIEDYQKVMQNFEGKDFGFMDMWHYNEDNVLDPDGLQLAVDYLHEMDDSLVQINEDADGNLAYDIDLTGDKLQRAADILHTTPEMVELLGRALMDVNKNVRLGAEQGGNAIERNYIDKIAEANARLKEAQAEASSIEPSAETGEIEVSTPTTSVEWQNAVSAAQEGMQRIRSIIQEAQSENPEIDVTTVVEGDEEIQQIAAQIADLPPEVQTEIGITVPGDADAIIEQLTGSGESVDVTANYKKGEQEEPEDKSADVSYEKSDQEEPDDKTATVNYTKGTQEMPTSPVHVSVIYDGLKTSLPTLTQRVTVIEEHPKASGTLSPTRAYANGTAYNVLNLRKAYANGKVALQQDEMALVNELGTESIIRNGNWYLLPKGMHQQALKKGDIVLSARQTKALINTGAAPGHGRAYALGTFLSHAHNDDIKNHGVSAQGVSFQKLGDTPQVTVDTGGGDSYINYGGGTTYAGGGDGGDSGEGGGGGGDDKEEETALDKFQEWLSKFFDWVEIKLDRVSTKIERFIDRADWATDRGAWGTANKNYRKAINRTADLTNYEQQANIKYSDQAKLILDEAVAQGLIDSGFAKKLIKLDRRGKIDIASYNEEVQEVIKNYQEWMDKAREANKSIEELHQNIREYTKSLKEVRDAQRDARLERIDNRETVGAGGLANFLGFSNRQIRFQRSLNNQRNATYRAETNLVTADVNSLANSAGSYLKKASAKKAVKKVPKKERDAYRKALREAKAAVKARKPIPSSALNTIRKYNITAYNRAYAYNVSLENLEDARYEEAINYSEVSAENFKATSDIYNNLDQKTQNAMDLNRQRSENATTAKSANKYLDKVAGGYDTTIKNDTKEINSYSRSVKKNKKTIKKNAGTTNTGKDRKKVTQAVESAKKSAKSGKAISPSILAKLAEYYSKGFVTYAFYKACIDYNNALDSKRNAETQKEIDKETAKAEKAAIGEQRVSNVEEAFNRKLERQEANASLYESQNNYKTTRGLSLSANDYRVLANNNRGQRKIAADTVAGIERTIAENIARGYWTYDSPEYMTAMTNLTNWKAKLVDLDTEHEELNNTIANLPFDEYDKALEKLDAIAERIESEVDLKSAKGVDLSKSDYDTQMRNNLDKYQQYLKKRDKAYEYYLKALAASDKVYGGKTAEEWMNMYNQFSADANNVLSDNEKLKDSLRDDVYWRDFERAHDAAQRFSETLEGINDLLDDNMFFDKDGKVTQWGIDHVANLVKQLETARTETKNFLNDFANLNKLYAEDMYTDIEYEEKKAEIIKGMLDSAATTKGVMNEIVDFYKDIDQHELDALMKLIDLRNEALSKKKAYYDYDKKIRNSTSEIQELEAQAAALQGVSDASSRAKLAKLQAQIAEKRESLEETQQEHLLDMQKEALTDLKDTLQEQFDEKWNYLSQDLDKMLDLMKTANALAVGSAKSITPSMEKLLSFYGIDAKAVGLDKAFASGIKRVGSPLIGLSSERGNEIIVTKNGIISKFNPGDGVVPADLTERLYYLAQAVKPNASIGQANFSSFRNGSSSGLAINQSYGSLITIQGSADAATVEDLKRFTKDILEKSYDYTTSRIKQDGNRTGLRRRI